MARQRRIGIDAALGETGARGLAGLGIGQNGGHTLGTGVGEVQEMADRHGSILRRPGGSPPPGWQGSVVGGGDIDARGV